MAGIPGRGNCVFVVSRCVGVRMTDPGPWDEMAEQEYAEWCAEFERDRMLEDAQDYLNELDSKEEF